MDKDLIQSIGIIFSILMGIVAFNLSRRQTEMLEEQLKLSTDQLKLSTDQLKLSSEQAKVLTRQVLANSSSTLANQLNEINRLKFQYPDFSEEMDGEYKGEYKSESENKRASIMAHLRLNLFEQVYSQYKQEMIDDDSLATWKEFMNFTFKSQFTCDHWKANRLYYGAGYGAGFREMIDEIEKNNRPNSETKES